MTNRTRTLFVPLFPMLFAGTCLVSPAQAQSVDLGADVMSRYVWRGTDFGNTMAIQPNLSFSLPVSASYYLNPYSERSYFIFGVSL